jgi:conjugative transposon TraM protein
MKINFKQPKYLLPLILMPFFFLGFYIYASNFKPKPTKKKDEAGMQGGIGEVSDDVKKKGLTNKLDAYRDQYKDADGVNNINPLEEEKSTQTGKPLPGTNATDAAQKRLDSISQAMQARYAIKPKRNNLSQEDKNLALALANLSKNGNHPENGSMNSDMSGTGDKPKDPMETFKRQMAFIDSMKRMNDPAYQAEMHKNLAMEKAARALKDENILEVQKGDETKAVFNTLSIKKDKSFIKAIIDENVTGYAGSRIRIRLLEDIKAGENLIKQGTYVYAEISGFTEQRVTLTIKSILTDNKILPVKLSVYDLDGLPGLYVPSSAFREFSKDLGNNTVQGVNIDNTSQSFSMSVMDKVFQSTSTAIADLIRKNKAKVKYDTFVYLIDPEELKQAQKSY